MRRIVIALTSIAAVVLGLLTTAAPAQASITDYYIYAQDFHPTSGPYGTVVTVSVMTDAPATCLIVAPPSTHVADLPKPCPHVVPTTQPNQWVTMQVTVTRPPGYTGNTLGIVTSIYDPATQEYGGGPALQFTVSPGRTLDGSHAAARAQPASGRVGSTFTLAGENWIPGGTIDITLPYGSSLTLYASTPVADSNGRWNVTATVGQSPPGAYQINLTEHINQVTVDRTATFRVLR